MTRDVLISISGSQSSESDQDEIEMVKTVNYFFNEGKNYILYEEIADKGDVIKNTIKVTKDSMEMIKRGSASLHMVFQKGKKNVSCYITPFGELMVGVCTSEIQIEEGEDLLKIQVVYSLEINGEHISNCNITVEVKPKNVQKTPALES